MEPDDPARASTRHQAQPIADSFVSKICVQTFRGCFCRCGIWLWIVTRSVFGIPPFKKPEGWEDPVSGDFLCCDFMDGGGVNIKGLHLRGSFDQVLYGFLHRVELFARVALGILSTLPKAEGEDAIRVRV